MLFAVIQIINSITLVLAWGGAVLGVFCLVDAASRRADAFPAADKKTKGTWVGITVACGVVLGLAIVTPIFAPQGLLWLAAMVGALVYLVDVRPRLKEITDPRNRW